MKTTTGLFASMREASRDFFRKYPRLRSFTRQRYWNMQAARFRAQAKKLPVEPHTVFFEAYGGRSYGCSPRAIYYAMLADPRCAGWRYIWGFKLGTELPDDPLLKHASTVVHGDEAYFHAMSTASFIIQNNRVLEYVSFKPEQTYVQCWHGTPLKRLGCDVTTSTGDASNIAGELAGRFTRDAKKWSYYLAPSDYTAQHLGSAFGLSGQEIKQKALVLGYPRNDALCTATEADTAAMRAKLGLPEDKKVLLYAPTWRDTTYQRGVGYVLDCLPDFDKLQAALKDEWLILFRPHYYIRQVFDFSKYEGFVYNAGIVGDINDCYIASDALLTDYSSVMFDYANLHRPILLYVSDLEQYAQDLHGFYFDIRDVPGPLCTTDDELIEAVQGLSSYEQEYGEDYSVFARRFCPLDDGHAAQRVLDALLK